LHLITYYKKEKGHYWQHTLDKQYHLVLYDLKAIVRQFKIAIAGALKSLTGALGAA
jgi:hypothetical protein